MDLTCKICGGSEDIGILNKAGSSIGRDISVSVAWVCCDICDGWHHNQCLKNLNVLTVSVGEGEKWMYPQCNCCCTQNLLFVCVKVNICYVLFKIVKTFIVIIVIF